MTPEELFHQHQHLVIPTLNNKFGNLNKYAQSVGLEKDDLIQMGRIGLWYACIHYNSNKNTEFETYAINCIKWIVMKEIANASYDLKVKYKKREENNVISFVSLDAPIEDNPEDTYYDFHSSHTYIDPETYVELQDIFNLFNDKDRKILEIISLGGNLSDVSIFLGVSRQAVAQRMNKIRRKLIKNGKQDCLNFVYK